VIGCGVVGPSDEESERAIDPAIGDFCSLLVEMAWTSAPLGEDDPGSDRTSKWFCLMKSNTEQSQALKRLTYSTGVVGVTFESSLEAS
jgi:hypothetical protein